MSAPAAPFTRFFNDPVNSIYLLPADEEEGRRLNIQHVALQHSIDYRVVLAPVSQWNAGDAVLDCATGTGNWALELATRIPPSVSITCIDVSPHLFPRHTPSNVSFERRSVLSLPAEWSGRYAFVHQRLLVFALRANEWQNEISELYRVTRPGGWAQLCEIDWLGIQPGEEHPHSRLLRDFHFKLSDTLGLDMGCARNLEARMKAAGFINVEVKVGRVAYGKLAGEGPHNATLPFYSYYTGALKVHSLKHGYVASEAEFDTEAEAMLEEWNTLPHAFVPFYWVWGQRSM